MQTWTFHDPPNCCKCLQNQTIRPEVDRTRVSHEAIDNGTRRSGRDRPIVWHVLNGTVALRTNISKTHFNDLAIQKGILDNAETLRKL